MTLGKLVGLVLVIAFEILTQIFSNPIQTMQDRLTMSRESTLNEIFIDLNLLSSSRGFEQLGVTPG
jgi:hypothetical protein